LSPLNHFTVPCAILTFFVLDTAPAPGTGTQRLTIAWASLSRNAWRVNRQPSHRPELTQTPT